MRSVLVIAFLVPLPALAAAPSPWLADPPVQAQLAAGEIVVRIEPDGQHVAAAVVIRASPETVWKIITDCEGAPQFMPGMKSCHRLASAADGSWETVEREFRYSWLMPAAHDVVRVEYHRPQRIDFQRLSGSFRDESGAWVLAPDQDGSRTLLEYQFYIDLGFWVPHSLIQHSLRNELPAAMKAVRAQAEAVPGAPIRP